jgi:pre-mRNA-processing factor SLU7
MHIAPDEKIETFELDYDGKRDQWNGYDVATYSRVVERYEARDEARRKYLKEQQLKKLEEKNNKQNEDGNDSDGDDDEDALKVDEAKVDESKQMDFAKVEKRVRTTGGGSTGTVRCDYCLLHYIFLCYLIIVHHNFYSNSFCFRNLSIREDIAKYLLNLDVNSAYYDPKTWSMREDSLSDADLDEKFYGVSALDIGNIMFFLFYLRIC